MLKKFNNLPYLGYKRKHVQNEPTEDSFLLIKQINKIMKSEGRIWYNFVKLGINKTIGHVKEAIQSKELESNNETTTFIDKGKQKWSVYHIKVEENTFRTSEKK